MSRKPFTVLCPVCNGQGGWIEPVLDTGEGPFYDCFFCKRKGRVFFLRTWILHSIIKWQEIIRLVKS